MKNPFRLPTPIEAARQQLAQAELSLLTAHMDAEQAACNASAAMCDLDKCETRVRRLRATVEEMAERAAPMISLTVHNNMSTVEKFGRDFIPHRSVGSP